MEDSAPEVEMISNEDPEEEASKTVVIKRSDKVEGSGDNIDLPLCGGLYKEKEDSLVPWSGTYPIFYFINTWLTSKPTSSVFIICINGRGTYFVIFS